MNALNTLSIYISNISNTYDSENLMNENSIVNFNMLEEKNKQIKDLTMLHTNISTMLLTLKTKLDFLKNEQDNRIKIINNFIEGLNPKIEDNKNEWVDICVKKNIEKTEVVKLMKNRKIYFSKTLFLNADVIYSFSQVAENGKLFYIEGANHLAFRLAGRLFHGNIGNIYYKMKDPKKIKECKFRDKCSKKYICPYYHDPLKYPDSNDIRNYISNSWIYNPTLSQYKNKFNSRQIGSRDNLDQDIHRINTEEINRFCDQTMNDILCMLLIKKYCSNI